MTINLIMKMKLWGKLLLAVITVPLIVSCSGKVKSTDVQIIDNEIIFNGKSYTGQVWSKDGESMVVEVSDGRPVKVTLYHDNGEPAMISTLFQENGEVKHFDINGYEMNKADWLRKYPDIGDKRQIMSDFFLPLYK